jgi:type IV secretory pathway TrbL component
MKKLFLFAALPLALAACDETSSSSTASTTPTAAEQACLRDVTSTTGNADVTLMGSEFSEAGTSVRVGVGDMRAPWNCIAYNDGTTAGIESLTDEGAL